MRVLIGMSCIQSIYSVNNQLMALEEQLKKYLSLERAKDLHAARC